MKVKNRTVVGMSGGVDSSVAATLLKKSGFDVVGVFLKFWKEPNTNCKTDSVNRCCSAESEKLARLVAKKIGIPFYVINVEKEFKQKVVDYFLKEYNKGNTPNPCVVCNKEIKFGLLLEKALKLGADFVATGHYALTSLGSNLRSATNFFPAVGNPLCLCGDKWTKACKKSIASLFKGVDEQKDQSYFLWQLSQNQIKHILFPIGGYTKTEVRKLAKKFDLPTADAPESQEVCFVNTTVNSFLKRYLKPKPGLIVDLNGKKIGMHQGLCFYTIGQRHGLNLQQGPWYAVAKNLKKNVLVVSNKEKDLFSKELTAKNVNWINPVKLPISAEVKLRYKSNFSKAKIFATNKNSVKIILQKTQKAVTPGQSVVFYKGQELLGGGIIA